MLVDFLDDAKLAAEVSQLLTVAEEAIESQRREFGKNVIDPFAAIFEMSGFGLDHAGWVRVELMRQAHKTLLNHIGGFHQNILGAVKGWENMKAGSVVDLVSRDRKVLAEVKNKHNTLSGGKRSDQYDNLAKLVMQKASRYHGYTAYFVTIIPKSPERFDRPFTPSDKETGARLPENAMIRQIDGAGFCELVTGREDALSGLFRAVPEVIAGISGKASDPADRAALAAYFHNAFGH